MLRFLLLCRNKKKTITATRDGMIDIKMTYNPTTIEILNFNSGCFKPHL